jgi:uncharacterized protein YdhG (YjbR/CyaY superfamily)
MTDVKAYFDAVPKERRSVVDALHALILRLYPDATVDMQYRMPTYHAGDGWVAIANQKHYVSLYTCGAHHLAEFKQKHPQIKTGKGCINFKCSDTLPLEDVELVVRHAIEHPKAL